MSLNSEIEYNFKCVNMINSTSLIYLTPTNNLFYIEDISKGNSISLSQDPLEKSLILKTNGNYTIVRHSDPYSNYAYRIFGSDIPIHEWDQTIIYQNSTYDVGVTLNNTIIFYGKDSYMFYKTDLGGFVRSKVIEMKNLMGVLINNEEDSNKIITFIGDDTKFNLIEEIQEIEELQLECDPETRLVRMVDESHAAEFLTKLNEEELEVAHHILWKNPVNLLGWVLWGFFSLIGLIALACILIHIFNFKKDNKLLERIQLEKEQEEDISRRYEEIVKKQKSNLGSKIGKENENIDVDFGTVSLDSMVWKNSLAENLITDTTGSGTFKSPRKSGKSDNNLSYK